MSRNKRNSYRTRSEGGALPLSEQLKAAAETTPVAEDGSRDYINAWVAPATEPTVDITADEAVAMVSGPEVDVEGLLRESGERLAELDLGEGKVEAMPLDIVQGTYTDPSIEQKAIIWLLKNDLAKASRWATAAANEPDRLVYDLFSEAELDETGVDFAGDNFSVATAWAVDQYQAYLDSQEVEGETNATDTGSNDELNVDEAPAISDSNDAQEAQYLLDIRSKYSLPDNWTDAAVYTWIAEEGFNDGVTARGNFFNDPTRRMERTLEQYTTTELLDAIQGKLSSSYIDVEAEIAAVYRQREKVDAAWSTRDLIDWLIQGLEPQKVSTGAWKNDVTRARRLAQDWTDQELQAWVKGEIASGGETTDQKIAIEINKRFDLGVVSVTPEDIRRVYQKMQSNAVKVVGVPKTADTPTNLQPEPAPVAKTETVIPQGLTAMNVAYLKTQTERYLKACAPGTPITAEIGAIEQRQLDNLIRYILKIDDATGFLNAMSFFRDFYAKNRDGLFEPTYSGRFTGSLRVEGKIQETHIKFLACMHVYTNPDKSSRKQFDLPDQLSVFPVERQNWLLEFFQRYC